LSNSLRTRLLRAEHVRSFCKTLERHASQHRARCAWIESHTRQDPQPTDRQRPLFGAAPPPS
jgi:hypothetical protein